MLVCFCKECDRNARRALLALEALRVRCGATLASDLAVPRADWEEAVEAVGKAVLEEQRLPRKKKELFMFTMIIFSVLLGCCSCEAVSTSSWGIAFRPTSFCDDCLRQTIPLAVVFQLIFIFSSFCCVAWTARCVRSSLTWRQDTTSDCGQDQRRYFIWRRLLHAS